MMFVWTLWQDLILMSSMSNTSELGGARVHIRAYGLGLALEKVSRAGGQAQNRAEGSRGEAGQGGAGGGRRDRGRAEAGTSTGRAAD